MDELATNGGTLLFRDQSSLGRVVCHRPGSSRTICSAVIYGAMSQPVRRQVMKGYINYLLYGTGIAESETVQPERDAISITPNPTRGLVRFSVAPQIQQLTITDITGRIVATCPVSGGNAVWTGRQSDGQPVPSGVYFCQAYTQIVPFTMVR